MKKGLTVLTLMLLCLGTNVVFGQMPVKPGMYKVEERAKTNVFEVKFRNLQTPQQAESLDALLLSKSGIIAASSNSNTQVCRIEVMKSVKEHELKELFDTQHLEVAKTFEE